MANSIFLKVLAGSLLAIVVGVYLSTIKVPEADDSRFPNSVYPWQIELLPSGNTRVFGLVIGESTLGEAEQSFKEVAQITLFVTKEAEPVIEAYFSQVKIGGLKAKMVLSIELPTDQVEAMFSRGARISTLDSGTREVTLSSEDAQQVRQLPISSITYLPSIHLDAELIEKRFGLPTEKVADSLGDAIHWLYPAKGMDIALSEENKEVIQYIVPAKFDTLMLPLKAAAKSE